MTFQELMDCYQVSDTDNNRYTYQQLLNSFRKNQVTPVIGAGLSHWVYPLWNQLLLEQAAHYGIKADVENLLQNNKYEEAASLLEEECTRQCFIRNLSYSFRPQLIEDKRADCPTYQTLIPQLFCGPIVTTNFDRVIEYLFETAQMSRPDLVTPLDEFQSRRIESALQNNSSILIKMHGDINDPGHLVLSKQSYDDTYGSDFIGPDFEKPMPAFLKKILQRNPLLFLGCSLSADRTCMVIRKCAGNCRQFAFLELPKETENKSDPMRPTLYDSRGRLIQGFQDRRRDIIGALNIEPIWYPYGMHNEALDAFFTKLAEDLNITQRQLIDAKYEPLHKLLGRKDVVSDIVHVLYEEESFCAWVEGPGGIGKTEICKAVHAELKRNFPALDMPYIDLSGITSLLGFYDAVAEGAKIDILSETGIDNNISDVLLWRLNEKYPLSANCKISRILYFDNWEDIWYGLERQEEKDNLVEWMRKILASQFKILVSSRVGTPSAFSAHEFYVQPLDFEKQNAVSSWKNDFEHLDSVKLFRSILSRDIVDEEWEAFQSLINQLEGHPLSIVLTATQARREVNLNVLLTRWDKARQNTTGMQKKHSSMETALRVSWDAVNKISSAVLQWGLHFYSLKEIPLEILDAMRGDIPDEHWQEGHAILMDANLVYVTRDRKAIAMLLPLKRQFEYLISSNKQIQEDCLIRWAHYIQNLLDSANQLSSIDYIYWHQKAVSLAPQIFYIMEQLMLYRTNLASQYLDKIILKATKYYRFYAQSLTLLDKLSVHYKEKSSCILANLLKSRGDILRRLGDFDGAQEAYDSAEPLYRQERDNLGLANLLKSRGNLFSRLGDFAGAQEAYDSAELLYRQTGDNLGLAGLLKSRGDLFCHLGDLDRAQEVYDSAEPLYRQESDNLGLANLLKSRGDLFSRLGDLDGAQEAYDSAEPLYRQERDNLGLAHLLKSRGDILHRLGDLDGAQEAYDSAEPLYRQERNNRGRGGLANLLKSRGDLFSRLGDFAGAQEAYDSAEPLYCQERDNLGLAHLLKSRGDILHRLGEVAGAQEAYDSAELLYRQERDKRGLANLLKSRGDLFSRLGDFAGAQEAYDSAEPLYRQERDNLGLANLLKSRGDLQRMHE